MMYTAHQDARKKWTKIVMAQTQWHIDTCMADERGSPTSHNLPQTITPIPCSLTTSHTTNHTPPLISWRSCG